MKPAPRPRGSSAPRGELGDATLGRRSARPARGAGRPGRARPAPARPTSARRAARRSRGLAERVGGGAPLLTRRCRRPWTSRFQARSNGSFAAASTSSSSSAASAAATSPSAARTSARVRGSVDADPEPGEDAPALLEALEHLARALVLAERDQRLDVERLAPVRDASRASPIASIRSRIRVSVASTARWSPATNSTKASAESRSASHQRRPAALAPARSAARSVSRARSVRPAVGVDERRECGTPSPTGPAARAARDRGARLLDEPLRVVPRPARSSANERCASRSARQRSSPRTRYHCSSTA